MEMEAQPNQDEKKPERKPKEKIKNKKVKLGKKKDNRRNSETNHSFIRGHQCFLPQSRRTEYVIDCNPIRKCLLFFIAAHETDIRAKNLYRSYASLCAEKYQQFRYYPFTIHPFSLYRYWLELFIVAVQFVGSTMLPIYMTARAELDIPKYTICFSDIIYLINIASNSFTGYVSGNTQKYVILDLKSIMSRYLRTLFFFDLISTSGLVFMHRGGSPSLTVILLSLKIFRIPTFYRYVGNIMDVNKAGLGVRSAVSILFLTKSYLDWNIFFQFAVDFYHENDFYPPNPRECSWISISKMWNETAAVRFAFALDRGVRMFRHNCNLHLMEREGCFEMFFIVSWIISRLVITHCSLFYMITMFSSESAQAKFCMMTDQVKTYLNQRRFPPGLKKKVLKFYAFRFQSLFFVESRMRACISGQLREDITLHAGRQVVNHLDFLKELPRGLLLQIEIRMKTTFFIEGDIIFKINTLGDCLYFIDKGTVAIYSESGKEICHLEDGEYFGEIALVMKNRFRTATAVAVTNCELFRLDKEDFESSISCYPTVYEDIKKVAMNRYERTCILDEHHKTDLRNQ